MQEPERREEARAVPEREERVTREEMPMGTVTPMMRGAYVPAWYSRVSWGAVFAGTFIAIATQIVLTALVTWIGLVSANIAAVGDLADALTATGIWVAINALISLFVGAYAASKLGAMRFASDGLWNGAVVWAVTLVTGVLLSVSGVTSGLLGAGANALVLLRGVVPTGGEISAQDIETVINNAGEAAGWFLLGALLALGAALLGGWLGSARMSRAEAMEEAAGRERMAA